MRKVGSWLHLAPPLLSLSCGWVARGGHELLRSNRWTGDRSCVSAWDPGKPEAVATQRSPAGFLHSNQSGFQDSRIQDSGRAVANQRRSFYIKTTQTHFHTPRSSFHRCFSSKGPCSGFPDDLIFHLFLGNQKCTISRKVQKEPDRRVDYIFLPLSLLDTVGHRRRPRLLIHFFSSKVTPGVWTRKRLGIGFDQIVVAGERIL